jgi:uncharacterized membrane protein
LTARIRKLLYELGEAFWLVPALMIVGGVVAAAIAIQLDRAGMPPRWLDGPWLYSGGPTGARTLLGAVATSTIAVAGTVFSVTIAALSLAAGQMGPRLLRNFTRDRGNQFTLGVFLATFAFCLVVLRGIRAEPNGAFVPHLALSIGIALAFVCVGTLVYFVGHMAGRINVDTVIDLVSDDVRAAVQRLSNLSPGPAPPPPEFWRESKPVTDSRHGYLLQLDEVALADWAAEHNTCVRLLVRPGGYVFPRAPIAMLTKPVEGADAAVRDATALGSQRASPDDVEYAVRQLVEVAVRALSPSVNDPQTAISVLDRLGSALCSLAPLCLPTGVFERDGRVVLYVPQADYAGLLDAMFHMIRQNASANPAVLIRILEVLTVVASCDQDPSRLQQLQRHADLALAAAERTVPAPPDLDDVRDRYAGFVATRQYGSLGRFTTT